MSESEEEGNIDLSEVQSKPKRGARSKATSEDEDDELLNPAADSDAEDGEDEDDELEGEDVYAHTTQGRKTFD